jgi:hypothetical protein
MRACGTPQILRRPYLEMRQKFYIYKYIKMIFFLLY